ncbi:hypothetical protein C5Y96_17495 [Blastopirellula marina]|uniref:4'-phosphopantetheinyl transferase domain-containing protein n=1 Tax=Blastopirellula marina TaxID=124 RepID=A0A2S8F5B4_9BACT|nr:MULTISPECIES: 4'-phosphopantetheinyl transferase family protein [Pirellulaceae]PQO27338.1 hypothetical protein C5Y96_17495 [Blastopirellula marina]RCS47875.1 hypothetical protein DTL36_17520 [Bremerella cremea]
MISTFPRIVRYVANFEKLSIPATLSWLTDLEMSELSFWKDLSRRNQWLAGRWVAKRILTRSTQTNQMREVEILSRGEDGLGRSPTISISGLATSYRLSISHSNRAILVGLSHGSDRIGVDVVTDIPEASTFRSRWFTDQEAKWIQTDAPSRLPIAWALKEAIFKACGQGSKWNPRLVELVSMDRNRVFSRINGIAAEPLTMWTRTTINGAIAAVWSENIAQEVMLCS